MEGVRRMSSSSFSVTPLRVDWEKGKVWYIDQRRIPFEEVWVETHDAETTYRAIKDMVLRGAPLIGVAGALGVYLQAKRLMERSVSLEEMRNNLSSSVELLKKARPTAVNLTWALSQVREVLEGAHTSEELLRLLREKAQEIINYERDVCVRMAEIGSELLLRIKPDLKRVSTHCNTGALATTGPGTALGVIRWLAKKRDILVWVDETRPYLQGARLTSWELLKEGIEHKVIADSVAPYLMSKGLVDAVLVGADRIARNGDTANKIGTYSLAVAAHRHGIPFIVVAPFSSIDFSLRSGEDIPIEERSEDEVHYVRGVRITPEGAKAYNPAFDVTPAELITYIVTERGAFKPKELEAHATSLKR